MIYQYCPICDLPHPVHELRRPAKVKIDNTVVSYIETYYICDTTEEEFIPAKIMDENLQRARMAYAKEKQEVTP